MENLEFEQPKEIVTTITARCKNCGTVWDMSRTVEVRDENGHLAETENAPVIQKCPSCFPNPTESIETEESVPVPEEEV